MPKERVYGSPIGVEKPSGDIGRPKKKDSDPALVRQALNKVATTPAPQRDTSKPVRGSSSSNFLRRTKPPAILDAEIEKQSR